MSGKSVASGEDETLPILSGEFAQVALACYRLRTAAHRIVADCERLLAEVEGPGREAWSDAVGKALLAGQHLRSIIERRGALKSRASGRAFLDSLMASFRGPRQSVIDAMSSLLALIPTDLEEELIMQDARGIREAAVGLLAAGSPVPGTTAGVDSGGGAHPSAASNGKARVLVVDDDADLRRQLGRMLERLGYDVTLAQDGREALGSAVADPPDLVITDLSMPAMSGHELLAALKASERTQQLPVIVVSGEGDAASVVKCLEQGAEDHLAKPYERVVLQARIRTSLERKRMRDLELAYLRRVAQLTSAAEAVERHSYDSGMVAGLIAEGDQLGQLARVFDRMLNGIRAREEQLESRLRHLRREIEHASRHSPIASSGAEGGGLAAGQVLAGRYDIKSELGSGGMGIVYLARDRELAEDVAVKVVRADVIGQDPSLLERLKSEMRLARRISHRNVVRSHDLGEWQGIYFLTMEYIKGVTVADLIAARGRLTVDSTLAIGMQLADALAVAHAAEIVHRDIKPQNLLVDEGGALKVTDFGLARPVRRTGGLTRAGIVVGTPRYMAPEQLLDGDVDARADLFATGVVLYECLTGRVPFDASTPAGIIARLVEGAPQPIGELEPSVPQGLVAAIERLLQRDPAKRFQSARELADQLAHVG